jgi:hypothetical protein
MEGENREAGGGRRKMEDWKAEYEEGGRNSYIHHDGHFLGPLFRERDVLHAYFCAVVFTEPNIATSPFGSFLRGIVNEGEVFDFGMGEDWDVGCRV